MRVKRTRGKNDEEVEEEEEEEENNNNNEENNERKVRTGKREISLSITATSVSMASLKPHFYTKRRKGRRKIEEKILKKKKKRTIENILRFTTCTRSNSTSFSFGRNANIKKVSRARWEPCHPPSSRQWQLLSYYITIVRRSCSLSRLFTPSSGK